jgi:hypothetical protein
LGVLCYHRIPVPRDLSQMAAVPVRNVDSAFSLCGGSGLSPMLF